MCVGGGEGEGGGGGWHYSVITEIRLLSPKTFYQSKARS